MNKLNVSIWLIPEEKQEKQLQKIIDNLAGKYRTFSYIPHVTVYALESDDVDKVIKISERTARNTRQLHIVFKMLSYSEVFNKTIFAQYKINPALQKIYDEFRMAFPNPPVYEINPHLSLIYKQNMTSGEKLNEITKIEVPQTLILNRLMIVTRNGSIAKEKDALGWQNVYYARLV